MNREEQINKIEEFLTRGVENIYPDKEKLRSLLISGKKIKVYAGFDPTAPSLHLGHQALIKKLAKIQELGHQVIFLVGDFTAMIGDPTDKKAARKKLTKKEVLINLKNYKKQASRLLKFPAGKVMFNSVWLNKLGTSGLLDLASYFTAQNMLARDMFQERIKQEKPVYLHEFIYPVLQAYDSVAMDVDLEIGGNDQMFNMLCGRNLMKDLKDKEKFVLTTKLMTDSEGKKMGKTDGNAIFLSDSPGEMFGKVMSWDDSLIIIGLELFSQMPMAKINELENGMKDGSINPKDAKILLAKEIVLINYGKVASEKAEREFNSIFKEKNQPNDILEVKINEGEMSILDFLVKANLVSSKNEAKRALLQGGVKIDNQIQSIEKINATIKKGQVVQVGKRKFAKVV